MATAVVEDTEQERALALAPLDENAGTTEENAAVVSARAYLAVHRIPMPRHTRDALLGTRARVALSLETAAGPEVVIADRCDEAAARRADPGEGDDKEGDWDGSPVLTPPPAKG